MSRRGPSAASLATALAAKGCNVTVELPDGTVIKAASPVAGAGPMDDDEGGAPVRNVFSKNVR